MDTDPRTLYGNQHTDRCHSLICPCWKEAYTLGKLHGTQDVIGHLLVWAEEQRGAQHDGVDHAE